MKILIVSPRFHTNMTMWVKTLIEKKHTVIINSLIKHEIEDYSLVTPKIFNLSIISKAIIFIFGPGGTNFKRGFPKFFSYFTYIKDLKPDIIIVRDLSRWFSFMAVIIAKLNGARIIIYSQNKIHNNFSFIRANLHNNFCRLFDPAFMSPLIGNIDNKKLKNTYFVPFIAKKYKLKKNKKDSFQILTIGKFTKRKNLIELIQIVKELLNEDFNIKLDIVGEVFTSEHLRNLEETLNEYNFSEEDSKVKIYVNIPHKNISNFYSKADLFILPATAEPASISVIEALANDIPVICSSTCGTGEYISPGRNGLIFKDKDFFEMKHNILEIMKKNYNYVNNNSPLSKGEYFYSFFSKMIKDQFGIHL